MKKTARILSLVMAVLLCIPLAALSSCKEKVKVDLRNLEPIPLSEERKAAMDSEDDTIRVLFPGLDKSAEDWRNQAVGRFERDTKKTVEYIPATYDILDVTARLFSAIAAKNPYDGVWATSGDYPLYYVKQYAQPIGDYINMDLMKEQNFINETIMDEFYKFDGEYYMVVPENFVNPFLCFYNKTMIEELDLEDPSELYKKDQWTVSKMHEMADKATRDTDGDGVNDTYGITTAYENLWQDMNYTSMVKQDSAGKFVLNFDDPALLQAFDYYRDVMYDKDARGTGAGGPTSTDFAKGNFLFLLDPIWAAWQMYTLTDDDPTFEWGAVPLPYGENNTEHYNSISSGGMCFVNGCPNPYTTATLIEYICQEDGAERKDVKEKYSQYLTDELEEMCLEMQEKPYYSMTMDSLLYNIGRDLLQSVGYGSDNATVIEKFRAEYQADLDEINTQVEWPETVEHDPYVFNFDTDTAGVEMSAALKSGEVTQATGDEAIDGSGSLKIAFDPSANGKTVTLATLTTDYRLYGYTNYHVSFDYKIDGEITEDTQFFVAYYNTETGKQKDAVYFKLESTAEGKKTIEGISLEPVSDDKTVFTMVIGAKNAPGTLIIDNLKIEQVRAD